MSPIIVTIQPEKPSDWKEIQADRVTPGNAGP